MSRLRLGLLAAIAAVLCVAPAAQATHTAFLDPLTLRQSGCQVKGLYGIPAGTTGATLATGVYLYVVTPRFGTTEAPNSCEAQPVQVNNAASQNAAYIQWNVTPGATSYRIYRASAATPTNFTLLAEIPSTLASAGAGCVPNTKDRCHFVDAGSAGTPASPPAQPAGLTQALSNPDVIIPQRVDYGDTDGGANTAADDPLSTGPAQADPPALKTDEFEFPPGLNANPTAAPKCTLAQLIGDPALHGTKDPAEDQCPRASQVGTVQVVAHSGGSGGRLTLIQGDIYNGETKSGSEPARLFVVLRPPCSAGSPPPIQPGSPTCNAILPAPNLEVEKSFLAAIAAIERRADGSVGIRVRTVQAETDEPLAKTTPIRSLVSGGLVGQSPLQVRGLKQTLWGFADQGTQDTADDKAFMSLPSSCSAFSLRAFKTVWSHDAVAEGSTGLQATNCEAVPFDPIITASVGGAGKTGTEQHPDLDVTITQAASEGPIKTARVVLPEAIGTNLAQIANVCSEEQVNANTCPAASNVGSVTAQSPLVVGNLTGSLFLVSSGGAFPKLVTILSGGGVTLRLDGTIDIENGTRIVNIFDGIPDIPLSSFALHINGGANGLLTNKKDLCSGAGNLDATFTAHAGKVVTRNVPLTVVGAGPCQITPPNVGRPTASVILKKVRRPRPTLQMKIRRPNATQGTALRSARLTLPKGLRFVRRARSRQFSFADGRLMARRAWTFTRSRATLRRSLGETEVIEVTFRRGSTRSSRAVRRRGVRQRLTYRIRVTDNSGRAFNLRVRSRPRR